MKNKREGWLLKWRDLVTPADPAVITSANDAQRKGGHITLQTQTLVSSPACGQIKFYCVICEQLSASLLALSHSEGKLYIFIFVNCGLPAKALICWCLAELTVG